MTAVRAPKTPIEAVLLARRPHGLPQDRPGGPGVRRAGPALHGHAGVKTAMRKLHARNRVHAILVARESGLIR